MLSIRNLDISFYNGKEQIRYTDRVCFDVQAGEIVALVGESGCGKSITALSVLRLLSRNARVSGEVLYEGRNLLALSEKEMDRVRGREISMIFQDIMYSLNPVFTIGSQMIEGMRRHLGTDKKTAREQAVGLLKRVGIQDAPAVMRKYPLNLASRGAFTFFFIHNNLIRPGFMLYNFFIFGKINPLCGIFAHKLKFS